MRDFYFIYDYNPDTHEYRKLCRHVNYIFQRYDKEACKWIDDPDLSEIFIGEDIYYDYITEEEAKKIILYNKIYNT